MFLYKLIFSINRIMTNTSIQNIINLNCSTLQSGDIHALFSKKEYPRFQIDSFYLNQDVSTREQYLYFLRILQKWNNNVASKDQTLNDCDYYKNEFIYSCLKNISVADSKCMDSSLKKLYKWYTSNKRPEPIYRLKTEDANKSRLEAWQIQNSYKSTLPLEIENYKRRYLYSNNNPNSKSKIQLGGSYNITGLTGLDYSNIERENRFNTLFSKENHLLRAAIEEKQVGDYLTNYKKAKISFSNSITKNFFKEEFNRNKQAVGSEKKTMNKFYATDHIKNYRFKIKNGSRPFGSSLSHTSTNYSSFYPPIRGNSRQRQFDETKLDESTIDAKIVPSNIDEVGLIGNPLEIKLRKKNKNKNQ